jgi:carbamoyltransferase
MGLIDLNRDPTPRQVRLFGLLWLPLFLVLVALVAWRRGAAMPLALVLAGLAAVVVALAAFAPVVVRALLVGWSFATFPLAWLVSHAILALVFFGVITPLGVVLRLWRHDPLGHSFDRAASSYWIPREGPRRDESYFHQF